MPGFVVSSGAVMTCSHGGQIKDAPAQPRALVSGTPIATVADQLTVLGCPGTGTGVVCTVVRWINVSTRVSANGSPILLQSSPPAGPVPGDGSIVGPPPPLPLVVAMQIRVVAT